MPKDEQSKIDKELEKTRKAAQKANEKEAEAQAKAADGAREKVENDPINKINPDVENVTTTNTFNGEPQEYEGTTESAPPPQ